MMKLVVIKGKMYSIFNRDGRPYVVEATGREYPLSRKVLNNMKDLINIVNHFDHIEAIKLPHDGRVNYG